MKKQTSHGFNTAAVKSNDEKLKVANVQMKRQASSEEKKKHHMNWNNIQCSKLLNFVSIVLCTSSMCKWRVCWKSGYIRYYVVHKTFFIYYRYRVDIKKLTTLYVPMHNGKKYMYSPSCELHQWNFSFKDICMSVHARLGITLSLLFGKREWNLIQIMASYAFFDYFFAQWDPQYSFFKRVCSVFKNNFWW